MWVPGNDSEMDAKQYDSLCILVDTVAVLEPEIPSFTDSVLADVAAAKLPSAIFCLPERAACIIWS